jgi:two-component system, cell cycle response regulator DivK
LYIEELLIDCNYNLIHAKDGQETVDIFEINPAISLILMDIKMPIMDGHTAARIIKGQNPGLPIIAQSAYALEHEIEKYSGIFDDYLTKPINEGILIEKISKFLKS